MNNILQKYVMSCFILLSMATYSQYDNGSITFGTGVLLSIGLQEELGFHASVQYNDNQQKFGYKATYNRYFVKASDPIASDYLNELGLDFMFKLFEIKSVRFVGGAGYIVNDYKLLRNGRDATEFFINTGRYNHGLQLSAMATYAITETFGTFAGIQFKSFGKRYDTFNFGLTYTIGL